MSDRRRAQLRCAIVLISIVFPVASLAQTFTVLTTFKYGYAYSPDSQLVQGFDGNLYSVAGQGGKCKADSGGCGVVYKMTLNGTVTVLYRFCQLNNCLDGLYPNELIQGNDGNFYGTTPLGGYGGGTFFKITPTGTLTTLRAFCGYQYCYTGIHPVGSILQASDGNFYGVTKYGGAFNCPGSLGCGTVYRMTPGGTYTVPHRFCTQTGCPDGAFPLGGLVQGRNGQLYGVTLTGGVHNSLCSIPGLLGECGTLFEITTSGTFTTLHDFCSEPDCSDGNYPAAGVIQGKDGYFYGPAEGGGVTNSACGSFGCGTIFRSSATGAVTTLYKFCSESGCSDGAAPNTPLLQASNGYLYGFTNDGTDPACFPNDILGCGTLFRVTTAGALKTLHRDGIGSFAALTQNTNGILYGVANSQIAFSLSLGLAPFVETVPTSGTVDSSVTILGTNLTGATSVTFNGTAAGFSVVSASEIKAAVPNGATTGFVKVTTPRGTLTSNSKFEVQ